ncbi:MAG: AAA family ATPase [bacterium]|nr:AAA family ATPase [bacterium]
MKISIRNFGPIKEAHFDLTKDLVVCYGKNNIGKSYAISVIYLLLKHLDKINHNDLDRIIHNEVKAFNHQAMEQKIRDEKKCDISDKINTLFKKILNKLLADKLADSLENTFGHRRRLKSFKARNAPLIQLETLSHTIKITVKDKVQIKSFTLDKDVYGEYPEKKLLYSIKKDRYTLWLGQAGPVGFAENLEIFITERFENLFSHISQGEDQLLFLPASRSGIDTGMQALVPIFAELSKNRASVGREFKIPAIKEPIADYILQLSGIHGIPTDNTHLSDIIKEIESEILEGEVGFDMEKKQLTYSPVDSGETMDMNSVSSMVAELSPFIAFLKYVLSEPIRKEPVRKTVIFIEEPEAHLHPAAQIMLAGIFVKMVKAGVKLVITSHSNYVFNKLSNLLITKQLSPEVFAPIVLKQTEKGSVSQLLEADELGIEDENFIDATEELFLEREHGLAMLEDEPDDK